MPAPILLYDGVCGFCDRVVQFVLQHDRRGVIRFATLQGAFARALVARHPELAGVDSLIFVENPDTADERVFVRSDGALRVAHWLDTPWKAATALGIVPRVVRDAAYDAFARIRYRVFGRFETCPLPRPEYRQRFLPD